MSQEPWIIGVVDDSEVMHEAMNTFLSSLGFGVELYESAEQFIGALATTRACCLVVDVNLGDISGIELVRELSARGSSLPFIMMTGSANQAVRRAAEEAGCAAFLTKPFSSEELSEALDWTIASGSPSSRA